MGDVRLDPNIITYNAGIGACEKGGQWPEALLLLREMGDVRLDPNIITYNAGIGACEKGGQWPEALSLLREMGDVKLDPNVITYNAGISACEKAGSGQRRCRCCGRWGTRRWIRTSSRTVLESARAR